MKAYKASRRDLPFNSSSDEERWYSEYFADPQAALDYLVKYSVDTAAEKTADEVRAETSDGSAMTIISSLKRDDMLIPDYGTPYYHVMGKIAPIEIK